MSNNATLSHGVSCLYIGAGRRRIKKETVFFFIVLDVRNEGIWVNDSVKLRNSRAAFSECILQLAIL